MKLRPKMLHLQLLSLKEVSIKYSNPNLKRPKTPLLILFSNFNLSYNGFDKHNNSAIYNYIPRRYSTHLYSDMWSGTYQGKLLLHSWQSILCGDMSRQTNGSMQPLHLLLYNCLFDNQRILARMMRKVEWVSGHIILTSNVLYFIKHTY